MPLRRLRPSSWAYAGRRAIHGFVVNNALDSAATLTYYAVLAVAPSLLVVLSLLGLVGASAPSADLLRELLHGLVPEESIQLLTPLMVSLARSPRSGWPLVIGAAGAIWSVSNYISAFSRATNRIYQVAEGRRTGWLRVQHMLFAVAALTLLSLVLLAVVSGTPLAARAMQVADLSPALTRQLLGFQAPVLIAAVLMLVNLLFFATPNVRKFQFRVLSPGSLVAIAAWALSSWALAEYLSSFFVLDPTYGTLGGVVLFLLWGYVGNCAMLFGAELDAGLERAQELQAGLPAEVQLQVPPRHSEQIVINRWSERRLEKRGRAIREAAERRRREEPD